MTTLKNITPYAIPVALLMMSVAFGAPAAHAERPGYETVKVRFAYDPTDSATRIYKDLNRVAHKACHNAGGTNSIRFNIHDKECKAEVVENAVQAIGRTDIAALHYGERTMTLLASR
jgi:UrcA family protein